MLKFAGILLVLLAGGLIGMVQSAKYAARPREIRTLLHALQRLETEIGYGHTQLPDAFAVLADIVPRPLRRLFADMAAALRASAAQSGQTAKEIWDATIREHWPATAMKAGEKEALLRLGATLGRSGRDDQIKHIRMAVLQLQTEEAAAREDQRRYEKLSRSLGLLGAGLIVILLV